MVFVGEKEGLRAWSEMNQNRKPVKNEINRCIRDNIWKCDMLELDRRSRSKAHTHVAVVLVLMKDFNVFYEKKYAHE